MNFYLLLNVISIAWIVSLFVLSINNGSRGALLIRQFSLFFSGLQFLVILSVWAFNSFIASSSFKLNYQFGR